jgi:hypothetical protein
MYLVTRFALLFVVFSFLASAAVAQKNDSWWKTSDEKRKVDKPKHTEKIELSYDRFKDETTLELKGMDVGDGVWFGAIAFSKGRAVPRGPAFVLFRFVTHNRRFQCLNGCDVTFLVNGKRISLGTASNVDRKIDSYLGSVYVIEVFGVAVPYATFKTIARASTIEFQAGSDEASLQASRIAALQDFAARIAPMITDLDN